MIDETKLKEWSDFSKSVNDMSPEELEAYAKSKFLDEYHQKAFLSGLHGIRTNWGKYE